MLANILQWDPEPGMHFVLPKLWQVLQAIRCEQIRDIARKDPTTNVDDKLPRIDFTSVAKLDRPAMLEFGMFEGQLREIMRRKGTNCTIGPRLLGGLQQDEDYQIVAPELWRGLLRGGISNRVGGLHVAVPAFVLMHYEADEDEVPPTQVEEFIVPYCDVLMRLVVIEPQASYYYLMHFPRKIYLQEAMRMFLRGLGYRTDGQWQFCFNFVDEHTVSLLEELPQTLVKELEVEWRMMSVRVEEVVLTYPQEENYAQNEHNNSHHVHEVASPRRGQDPYDNEQHMSNSNVAVASDESREAAIVNQEVDDALEDMIAEAPYTAENESQKYDRLNRALQHEQVYYAKQDKISVQKKQVGFREVTGLRHQQSVQIVQSAPPPRLFTGDVVRARELEKLAESLPLILINDALTEEHAKADLQAIAKELLEAADTKTRTNHKAPIASD